MTAVRYVIAGVAFALLVGIAAGPFAEEPKPTTGNDLYARCTSSSALERTWCLGYIQGMADGLAGEHESGVNVESLSFGVCFPDSPVPTSQFRDIVVQYLERNPQTRHHPAYDLVVNAFLEAFPCSEAKP